MERTWAGTGFPQHQPLPTGKCRHFHQEMVLISSRNTGPSSALPGKQGCISDPWSVNIAPQGKNLQKNLLENLGPEGLPKALTQQL